MEAAPFALKLHMLKAEVMETLLYGCVTWTLGKEHFAELRTAQQRFLLRIMASSVDNAQTTSCRTPRLLRRHNARASRRPSVSGLFAAAIQRTHNERLTLRAMFGTMAGGENP